MSKILTLSDPVILRLDKIRSKYNMSYSEAVKKVLIEAHRWKIKEKR